MNDAGVVRGGEGVGDLAADLQRLLEIERRVSEAGGEIFAVEPLHRDVGGAFFVAEAEGIGGHRVERAERDEADDSRGYGGQSPVVRAREAREELAFAEEALVLRGVIRAGGDDLEGDVDAGESTSRAVNDAGCAAPDLPHDLEPARDEAGGRGIDHAGLRVIMERRWVTA